MEAATIWQIIVGVFGSVVSAFLLPLARTWGKKLAADLIDRAADEAVRYIDDLVANKGQSLSGEAKLDKAINMVCEKLKIDRAVAESAVRAAYQRWVESDGEAKAKEKATTKPTPE